MKSRSQQFLDAITASDPSLLPNPVTREERFLHALCTGEIITPTTFEEQFLQAALAFKGGDGPITVDPDELTTKVLHDYSVGVESGVLSSDAINYYAQPFSLSGTDGTTIRDVSVWARVLSDAGEFKVLIAKDTGLNRPDTVAPLFVSEPIQLTSTTMVKTTIPPFDLNLVAGDQYYIVTSVADSPPELDIYQGRTGDAIASRMYYINSSSTWKSGSGSLAYEMTIVK